MLGLGLDYYRGHTVYRCLGDVDGDYEIDIPGTGVSAFHTRDFRFDMKEWNYFKARESIYRATTTYCTRRIM